MTLCSEIIADVEAAENGSHVGAFFDFDGTIINGFSVTVFLREQLRAGHVSIEELIKLTRWMTSFGIGSLDFASLMSLTSQFLADMPEEEIESFSKKIYEKYIAKSIYPESRALIEAHLKKGHTVAIISSATQYQVKYAADDLFIEHCHTSELEVENKKLTGRLHRSCYGVGKVRAAQTLIKDYDLDPKQCFFYSDGEEDLPLLKMVGKPRPLNPTKKLTKIAKQNDWPIRRFSSRGMPSLPTVAKSFGSYGAFVGSFAAGLPIWALTGSAKKARNFSTSLFADSASALVGLDLQVKNEHYLWSHRPAVFIINHQSKADLLIAANLVRRDIVGIGKKEIKNIPVIGSILENAGMVLIDRKNAQSSIEAMQPIVDAITKDQQSLVVAPEGTRSISKKIAAFKKGPFHIAMQAQVPVIPIVIHNALDCAPRGQLTFTPATVRVEILEPIDTSNWTKENLNENIEAIRALYQETLSETRSGKSLKKIVSDDKKSPTSKKATKKKLTKKKSKTKKSSIEKPAIKKLKKRNAVKKPANASSTANTPVKGSAKNGVKEKIIAKKKSVTKKTVDNKAVKKKANIKSAAIDRTEIAK